MSLKHSKMKRKKLLKIKYWSFQLKFFLWFFLFLYKYLYIKKKKKIELFLNAVFHLFQSNYSQIQSMSTADQPHFVASRERECCKTIQYPSSLVCRLQ